MYSKKLIGKVHLWLGILSGLVVLVVSFTGCLYVFEKEIQDFTQSYRFVICTKKEVFLSPSSLKKIAERALPNTQFEMVYYHGENKSAIVTAYQEDPHKYYQVFINPYTGQVLKIKNLDYDFFHIIVNLHYRLLLPYEIGSEIVAYATLIFLVMIISGIVLWWPKNKNATKQRFTIKWNARWRRKNYDLHSILGFYASWVLIFVVITGLVWSFEWASGAVQWVASAGAKTIDYYKPLSDTSQLSTLTVAERVDKAWQTLTQGNSIQHSIVIFPQDLKDPIEIRVNPSQETLYKMDNYFFDQFSLHLLPVDHAWGQYDNTSAAQKVERMNYDIHTGAILGLPGKLLAFFGSLIASSLPITGFLIWYGRQKKKTAPSKIPIS